MIDDEIKKALIEGASTIAHLLGMLDVALGYGGHSQMLPDWAFEVQNKLEELAGREDGGK